MKPQVIIEAGLFYRGAMRRFLENERKLLPSIYWVEDKTWFDSLFRVMGDIGELEVFAEDLKRYLRRVKK